MRHPSRYLTLALTALLVSGVAACNSAAEPPPGMKKGGTLRAIITSLPAHLDPQRINAALDANVSRLISRTLTMLKSEPGKASSELVNDLATDLGRPSENNTVWEFKLRDGVKWADGSPITCQHLKYGAERNFAGFAATGLPYARAYLRDNATPYQGPFKGGNVGLDSVQCTDTKTIRYILRQPIGDFNYTAGLTIFAPVKLGADSDDAEFDRGPLASGPYKVKSGSRTDTEMLLIRNEHWSETTDRVRKAFPDQILLKVEKNVPAVTNALIEDQGEARDTISLNQDVSANFVQQVMTDANLLRRTAYGPSGGVRYMFINTQMIPNEKCRQALAYAFNKRKFRQAMGGSLLGELATTILPPTLRAYKKFDHYGTLTNGGDGDPKSASDLITTANSEGGNCPKKLTVAFSENATTNNRFVKTLVDAYLEIGIAVTLKPIPPGDYFDWLAKYETQKEIHMAYASWIPDWANGSAVIPPMFRSSEVADEPGEQGGWNLSYLRDPEIDKAIDEAIAESNLERQYKLWGDIDSKIAQKAAAIPIMYANAIRLHGSNVSGAFIHGGLGMPDLCALGLLVPGSSTS